MNKNDKELIKTIESNDTENFKNLFSKVKDKEKRFEYGKFSDWTVLHIACENSAISIVDSIFQIVPDFNVNVADQNGRTPLQRAVIQNNLELTKRLRNKGANLDLESETIGRPIWSSLSRGNLTMSLYLLDEGADINEDQQALILLIQNFSMEEIKKFLEKGINFDPSKSKNLIMNLLLEGKEAGKIYDKLKYLLERKFDPNEIYDGGPTPIFGAIAQDNVALIQLSIEFGADFNFKDSSGEDRTPLDFAIEEEKYRSAKYLLSLGATCNVENAESDFFLSLSKEAYRYELNFINVTSDQIEFIKEHFLDYSGESGFYTIDYEFYEKESEFEIKFQSLKLFNMKDENDDDLNDNIYHALVGKGQFFSNFTYNTNAKFDDKTIVYFVDHNAFKWKAELSKYSGLTKED